MREGSNLPLDLPAGPVPQATAAMTACDGIVLVVDAVEGVMMQTETLIKNAILERLPIVLVINKARRVRTRHV